MNLPVPAHTRGPQIRDRIEREWMPRLNALGRSVAPHVRELADLS